MTASLHGKVALVTGGSRGIGLAIARALGGAGARVALTARDAAALRDAAGQTRAAGAEEVEAIPADVRRFEEVERLIAEVTGRLGGVDVLVNNAGVGVFADVADLTPAQWSEVIDTNLTAVFNTCRAVLPALRSRGGGFIVNISSLASMNPFKGGAAYCASKAALNAFSDALLQEVRYDNIRVSCVLPGSVATGFAGNAPQGADWKVAPEDVAEVVVNLLRHDPRCLPSRVEIRPSKPRK